MPNLIPVEHDPFDMAGMLAQAGGAQDQIGSADQLIPPPRNPARMPQMAEDLAKAMTVDPFVDAAKALRGQMTPDEQQNFAMMAGLGLISPMARGVKPVTQGIRAYHVSPHDYERPDISKIGTGQGAQSYGHGLYGAESKTVRDTYWDEFAAKMGVHSASPEYLAARMNYNYEGDIPKAIAELQGRLKTSQMDPKRTNIPAAIEILQGGKVPGPRTYEWNINAKPEQFLDWDKPLSKQAPPVQDFLREQALAVPGDAPGPRRAGKHIATYQAERDAPGSDVYRALSQSLVKPEDLRTGFMAESPYTASNALREAGIPGIKYLDQGSRLMPGSEVRQIFNGKWAAFDKEGVPSGFYDTKEAALKSVEPTSNYVLFDDKLIDILRKYGIAGLSMVPPAVAAHVKSRLVPVDHDPFAAQ